MLYSFKILKKGDKVLNVWENRIAILRKNGEVDIFTIAFNEGSLPKIERDVVKITYGNETVEVTDRNTANKSTERESENDDDDDFVISIKSPKR